MGSIKTKREEQFRDFTSGVTMGISGALFLCAFTELKAALEDREKAKNVSKDNHLSPNALGSIVLLITALDSYLNEIIQQMCPCGKDAYGFKKLVDLDAAEKYREILKIKAEKDDPGRADFPVITDLKIVVDLRDEIIHFLPRVVPRDGPKKNVPLWFDRLEKKACFFIVQS